MRISWFRLCTAAMLGGCAVVAGGCAKNSNTAQAPSTGDHAAPATIEEALEKVHDEGTAKDAVGLLVALSRAPDVLERMRVQQWAMTEQEYISRPHDVREALMEAYLVLSTSMRLLARAALDEARTLAAQGRSTEAEERFRAVQMLADANRGPETVLLAHIVSEAIDRSVAEARADVKAYGDGE